MLVLRVSLLLFLCSLIVPVISWDPTTPFPSCLLSGVTWDPHHVIDLLQDVQSPESCQLSCFDNEDCAGFSWISEDIDLIVAHSCLLFSQIDEETPHKNIISGPPSCPCTISGGCVADDHNVLDALTDITDADQCKNICSETEGCAAYTFVEEHHVFSHFCVLYSSCDDVDPACKECTTGVPDCQHCSLAETSGGQCLSCASTADLISIAPAVEGYSSRMLLCDDPKDGTCEQDLETLCSEGFHLCTYQEFITLNDGWNTSVSARQTPVGEIYCRTSSGAGHFTLGYNNYDMIPLDYDEPRNCRYGSSRPQCPTRYGCNDKDVSALCCSPSPSCGDGVVDDPMEECDDGNDSDEDDCLSTCTLRKPDSDC